MRKRNLIVIVGIISFIIIVIGVSYSYFVYNKDIAEVSLDTGDISINLANINGGINLSNVIPKMDNEGMVSTDYLDFTVNATIDTDRIYYEVYILPKAGNTLDTTYLKTYLTDQSNNVINNVSSYNSLTNSEVENGKTIYRGLVELNNSQTTKNETKNFRLRLWLDENYSELSSRTFDFDVYLYAKNVDANFRLNPVICKRATTLHTEECSYTSGSDYCRRAGYYVGGSKNTATITYGNENVISGQLTTGDAFDCDVDGTGYNQRFYYISDRWIPGIDVNNFDTTTAVLVYYRNVVSGLPNDSGGAYYVTARQNWYGPLTAVTHLPKTVENSGTWRNNFLKSKTRPIISYAYGDHGATSPYILTSGGTLPTSFSYSGYAGRLLTLNELVKGCKGNNSINQPGSLYKCAFLFEKTKYANISGYPTTGFWLETPRYDSNSSAYSLSSMNDCFISDYVDNNSDYGIRPVIEVDKADIEY